MTHIFVSYAASDSAIAQSLAAALRDRDTSVFYYEHKDSRGQGFVDLIESEIQKSDLFVIVLSPDYLTSYWCRRERNLALALEADLGQQLIYVFQVAETPYAATGFVRTIDWLDLTPPVDAAKLRDTVAALKRPRALAATPTPTVQPRPQPTFHNRKDEIAKIVHMFTTAGGQDFCLVGASPRMGKSWFLERVAFDVKEKQPATQTRLVDLRTYSAELHTNWVLLLCTLLAVDPPGSGTLTPNDEKAIAVAVSRRSCPQLYLLDSAELMTDECIERFRLALTSIYHHLDQTGNTRTRLSLLVASRRHERWVGYGRTYRSEPFEPLELTEFGFNVVKQALGDLGRGFGPTRLNDWSRALHKLSEGLPALLVASLSWAQSKEFLYIEDCDDETAFTTVARPYISDDLLAEPSLLPFVDSVSPSRKTVLELALHAITPYRLFTQSHLKHHLDSDAVFTGALAAATWSLDDLWEALGRTALLKQQSTEIWQELNPPIRRLLYRYYYPDTERRKEAHAAARRFYDDWADGMDPRGQCVALLECLWHEATTLAYERPGELSELPDMASELTSAIVQPSGYRPIELAQFVTNRMRKDAEFATLVNFDENLFERVQDSIRRTISGGGG